MVDRNSIQTGNDSGTPTLPLKLRPWPQPLAQSLDRIAALRLGPIEGLVGALQQGRVGIVWQVFGDTNIMISA